jgi:phage terminase large subunit-like protein
MDLVTDLVTERVVMRYIDDVLHDRLPACKWVKLACQRHLDDLEYGTERGLWFDYEAAHLVVGFFGLLKHSKGEWAGQSIQLEPWQQFILWVLFGWKKADGTRRFRTAYIEVARKNGKSTFAAGIGLYLLVADGEPGAEVYSAATMRSQARITHSEASRMVKKSPALRKRITVFKDNLHMQDGAAKFEPLGRDSSNLDGLNIHGAIIDELHAHKTPEMVDVLDTATGSRRQPMTLEITTAGFDRSTICFQHHDYSEKVLEGTFENDAWFGIMFTLDADDDWEDEAVWVKSNPNLGVSKKIEDLRTKAQKAKEIPSSQNAFLTKELDVWTQSSARWIPVDHWNECGKAVDQNGLRGRICYGGLDLSSTTDITGFLMVFPPETAKDDYQVLCRFFIPEEAMHERSKRDRVPYETWVRQGYIEATPGNVIDYEYILAQIDEDMQLFDIKEIAFDRWGASKIQTNLMDMGGDEFLVQFGQGFASMNAPMKELEKLVLSHKLAHGNNPVLTWMAGNLVAAIDAAGNMKPDKSRSIEKIDGMVALIMGLDRATRLGGTQESVYETRGLRSV